MDKREETMVVDMVMVMDQEMERTRMSSTRVPRAEYIDIWWGQLRNYLKSTWTSNKLSNLIYSGLKSLR